jgi:endonuclease/exonuclease/phosphatase family metal-dependent hydrolase
MPRATIRKRVAIAAFIVVACALGWYGQSRLFARHRCVRIVETVPRRDAAVSISPRSPASIRVATFNIAHARGGAFGASNWTGASKDEVRSRLAKIARQVAGAGADVLVLNEVDFDASWSRSIDEAVEIAGRAGFGYAAEQRNIDVTLPFRTFRFGNAILSRYPIEKARAVRFPPFSKLEALLAGNHDGLVAEVLTPIGRLDVLAVHLEYRSEAARLDGARIVNTLVARSSHPSIAVGDFNSIPRFARKHREYVAPPETAVDLLLSSGNLSVSKASVDWSQYVTFPSARPDRAIDWILTTPGLYQGAPVVTRSDLSDHFMVTVPVSVRSIY